MRTRWIWMALCALPLAAEPEGPVIREGKYWVQTVEGTAPAAPGGRLKVNSVGAIVVRGDAGPSLRYSAKKRVRTDSLEEAKRLLGRAQVRVSRQGYGAVIDVGGPVCGRCDFSADLQIQVPRTTQETVLATHGGTLEVYDIEGRVNAETAGGSIQMDRIGKAVLAGTAGGAITLGAIGGAVRCETAGGSIKVGSAGGDTVLTTNGGGIEVGQVEGTLRVESAGGSIRAGRVTGNVVAETAGGSIHLSKIGGRVNADTAGGSITVESASGGVNAENADGGIKLLDVAGALRAATASGNIWAQLEGQPILDSVLETSMGDIVVLIPRQLRLTIRAHVDVATSLARIQCEFADVNIRLVDQGPGPRSLVAEGAINGGGPLLRIHNTSGTIQIKRK